jgi:iron complex outermembrane receptor protein
MRISWRSRPPLRTVRSGARFSGLVLCSVSILNSFPLLLRAQQPAGTERESRDSVTRAARTLEKMTVTAIRGGESAPISAKTLERAEIEQRYYGQDVPLVLQSAPSLTSYAETGTYWGYSYIRLRGIDQSRINLTLDGIPLNDPEDQVLYFTDFPDLANSLQSVQIQRGTGTSSNGTASYGGSINFETTGLATLGRSGNVSVGGGSFGAKRASVEYHSGLLPNRLAFYTRISAYDIAGYRYHSGLEGRSFFVSGGWFGDRDIVKVTATAGLFADTLSYLAVPASELASDRRINPLHPNELDRFGEQLGALSYTRLLGLTSSLSTTVYRIAASGNYDVFIDPDLWNQNLDFVWYGVTSTWQWGAANAHGVHVNAGVNANTYGRDHYLFIRPDMTHRVYSNTGHKRDASGFAKVSYDVGRLTLFGDAQLRWAEFRYTPDVNADIAGSSIGWRFFNPKVGATWRASAPLKVYASYGVNGREPARSDMFAGFDNLDTSNVAFVGDFSRVRPERANDIEAGLEYSVPTFTVGANLFDMRFSNEILPIGELSYIGTPLRKNVRSSRRSGLEVDARYAGIPRLVLSGNTTLMRGRIGEYTDDATSQTYHDVEPLLTPHVLANARAELAVSRAATVRLEGRYTGRSYLRNTSERQFMLPSAFILDGGVIWRVARDHLEMSLQGNNLTNSKRYASGYSDGQQSYFFVLPPRNAMVGVRVMF